VTDGTGVVSDVWPNVYTDKNPGATESEPHVGFAQRTETMRSIHRCM
jgi:hypothetical protein